MKMQHRIAKQPSTKHKAYIPFTNSQPKSTIAACKYLRELYGEFNSWTLAAAAYNGGSPRIQHAINRQNRGDYYLMHLNSETASYVYKLIAMKEVIRKPKEYGYQHVYTAYSAPAQLLAVN